MKARFALAAFLLVIGIVLPVLAVAKRGPPWGYRGHAAVLVEAIGAVELQASDERMTREKRADPGLKPAPGLFLDAGDQIRVPRYCEARVRMPTAELAIGDGGKVIVDGDNAVTISRGIVDVHLPSGGTVPFEVKAEGIDGKLTLRSGGSAGGAVRIMADGVSQLRALVQSGTVDGGGSVMGEPGKMVVVGKGEPAHLEAPASSIVLSPVCDGKKLTLDAPRGTQLFVGATGVQYPSKEGKLVVDVSGGKVPVFARDLSGNVARLEVDCSGAPATPPPPKKLPAPPPKTK